MKIAEEIVTSRQNRIVVDAVKLLDKKAREKAGCFRFDGFKLFAEALEKGVEISRVLVCESKLERACELLENGNADTRDISVTVLSDDLFLKVSEEQAPEGIVCVANFLSKHKLKADFNSIEALAREESRRILLLESVRDPGNLGTIIRSAAAFGVDTLVLSGDCADIYNPKTLRGAMGALFKVEVLRTQNLVEAIETLKKHGRNIYAAALDKNAVRLDETSFSTRDAAVIGNEGHGLSEAVIQACGKSLYIPMEDGSESLNAAVAASVIMWSMYRNG
jgi:TrmH family RNA methyltransferase